jgi:hypothetical protein
MIFNSPEIYRPRYELADRMRWPENEDYCAQFKGYSAQPKKVEALFPNDFLAATPITPRVSSAGTQQPRRSDLCLS